jgi:hypothetical protein
MHDILVIWYDMDGTENISDNRTSSVVCIRWQKRMFTGPLPSNGIFLLN